ncbi:MAG: DUF106 domain-containing protein [Euryarchaeota archaeon]|nr:DUF106 domain-containing protein [Euryarchaeota archaeon]MBV1729015.1 DUF106 domain-containing protein [Methanobacterium sp.]MBU4548039.1 DUF106 domain-containing protein [Euryarchaeota archaeon]MBU4607301.1 DUF106 domain-containing protein [Euryarchaeota archaeon]MBV1756026.1 DUF106 domain-containing protein [Methanobacterium sp.]
MVLEIIYEALNVILGPLIAIDPNSQNPMFAIFVISTLVAFITTLANKLLVNQDRLQSLKKEMQEFQQEMNNARKSGDAKALEKIQKQQMDFMNKQKEMMTMSFKPMIVTFLPIILVFYWMAQEPSISQTVVMLPQVAYYVLLVPLWHTFYVPAATTPPGAIEWLGWYILCSFAMSQVFRKFMGLKGGM